MSYVRKTKQERTRLFKSSLEVVRSQVQRSISFFGKFKIPCGLVLVCAESGKAKTTTAANMAYQFINSSKKDVVIITNEEMPADILTRVACIHHGYDWSAFRFGKLSDTEGAEILETAEILGERIEVIDPEEQETTTLEVVVQILESLAKDKQVGLVLFDYLQTVNQSSESPEQSSVTVSKRLGFKLKDLARHIPYVLAVFAQIRPAPKDNKATLDFSERIQNDRTIVNHALSVIEVKPNFLAKTTEFTVHKDRFGMQTGRTHTMKWVNGRYENLSETEGDPCKTF